MQNFLKYFTYIIIALYFFLGIYILVSPTFKHLNPQIKWIFAVFLFLYGGFRIARVWTKNRERRDEE
jgi:hypothetical protein